MLQSTQTMESTSSTLSCAPGCEHLSKPCGWRYNANLTGCQGLLSELEQLVEPPHGAENGNLQVRLSAREFNHAMDNGQPATTQVLFEITPILKDHIGEDFRGGKKIVRSGECWIMGIIENGIITLNPEPAHTVFP
jgi:hypothetical protein